jgi:predicted alpha/beta-fold hydrolase
MPEQSLGCVAEANAVALYLRNTLGVTAPIVFTGMSFGGAMAGVWPGASNADTCSRASVSLESTFLPQQN